MKSDSRALSFWMVAGVFFAFSQPRTSAEEPSIRRPDSNTVILVAEEMTFRRISPARYGKTENDFFLQTTEVANAAFARFLNDTGQLKMDSWMARTQRDRREQERRTGVMRRSTTDAGAVIRNEALLWDYNQPPPGKERCPVALVDYLEAREFCQWLGRRYPKVGRFRLPNKQEWMVAAYGSGRNYPWGDQWNPEIPWVSATSDRSEPVAVNLPTRDQTPEGICHLWGNLTEWSLGYWDEPFEIWPTGVPKSLGDTAFMGPSFASRSQPSQWLKPRQDYWGFIHNPLSRSEETGFRVLLVPGTNLTNPASPRAPVR
jgi:formylglycine-generating enzyme required for sulfatase activity